MDAVFKEHGGSVFGLFLSLLILYVPLLIFGVLSAHKHIVFSTLLSYVTYL